MNEKIRSLQREASEKHREAEALLSKAEVSGADEEKAGKLIDEVKAAKAAIAREFTLEEKRASLKNLGDDDDDLDDEVLNFKHAGKTKGSSQQVLGMSEAGKAVIDSFGGTVKDAGPGLLGVKTWDAMQSEEYRVGYAAYLRGKGSMGAVKRHSTLAYKALQEGLDDQGGVFVPAETLMRIIGREATPTRLASMVTTVTTSRDRIQMPRTQYATDNLYPTAFRATFTGEIPSSSTVADVDDTNLFGEIGIDVYTAMLSGAVTNDMLEDSLFPIQGWFESQFRTTDALLRDNMILNGTGVAQPFGAVASPGATGQPEVVLSGSAGAVSADAIVDLPYQIPEQYDENCMWVLNKTNCARTIAKLKDSQNNYLFSSGWDNRGIANSRPTNLVGYPFVYSGFMPDIGASNHPMLFGDLRGIYLVNRLGITIQILRETQAKRNQVELIARTRFGGRVVEPWRMRLMKSNNS